MERNGIFIVALLGLILTCCNSPKRNGIGINRVVMPAWAKSGEHPDYPDAEFLTAYGLARRPLDAVENAERGLESMICREAVNNHRELLKDSHFLQLVTEPAAWFDIGEFGNAVQSDAAGDGFEAVAVRAISRNELKLRATTMLPGANGELAGAMEPPGGIGSILDRMERWGKYYLLAVRVVALELIASDTLNRTAFAKVEQALLALWELPGVIDSTEANAGQHLRLSAGVAQPLELHAWFRNKPVANVPVQWAPGTGFRGDVQGDKETDANGRATARVHYIASTGDDFCYVQCRLDLNRVAGRRLGISMSVWLWQVMMPSRKTGEIVFRIKEETGYDKIFTDEFKKWCAGRNFNVVDDDPSEHSDILYHLALEAEPTLKLIEANGTTQGYVSGTFTLKDLETGTVLFRYTLGMQRKGQPGSAEGTVALLTLREGATEVLMEMAPRLLATLPSPDDGFGG
ncbi:MAG: hypothetical protein K8I27_13825 [Planctomycetes bacterium]|nr:hypothetical protein [Planctomycetota bacterium]